MIDAIIDAITDFATWWRDLFAWLFAIAECFVRDIYISIFSGTLMAVANIVQSIEVPEFMTAYSIGQVLNGVHPVILYYLGKARLGECLALLAAGYAFRAGRHWTRIFF